MVLTEKSQHFLMIFLSLTAGRPGEIPDLGSLIQQRLNEADTDPMAPPYDELRLYAYEGGNDTPVDLSEIEDNDQDDTVDFDFLNAWGPRFEVCDFIAAVT